MNARFASFLALGLAAAIGTGYSSREYWTSYNGINKTQTSHAQKQNWLVKPHNSDPTQRYYQPVKQALNLQWSPMDEFVKRQRRRSYVKVTHEMVPRPLDLQLPVASDVRAAAVSISDRFGDKPSADLATSNARRNDAASSNLNPNIDEHYSTSKSNNQLFDKSSMMRGFTKNSWINSNVGIQGGLAIKDEQLRDNDNNSIRDDMAVGMGVLFAF